MNDPHVVALIYTVGHGNSVSYENACPLNYDEHPEFHLTVDNKIARFEFKKHYADKDKALEKIEPFIQDWEFDATLRRGPNSFSLRYERAELIDRKPSPPARKSGTINLRAEVLLTGNLTTRANLTHVVPHYPSPPPVGSVNVNDSAVVEMKREYDKYRLGRLPLAHMAYFCTTALKKKYGSLDTAAAACGVSNNHLKKIGKLSSWKGGRKADSGDLSPSEERFLKEAIPDIIIKLAEATSVDNEST